jgi:hypothetical protein
MVINSAVPIFRASSTYVRAELACIVVAVRGAGMHSLVDVRQPVCAAIPIWLEASQVRKMVNYRETICHARAGCGQRTDRKRTQSTTVLKGADNLQLPCSAGNPRITGELVLGPSPVSMTHRCKKGHNS